MKTYPVKIPQILSALLIPLLLSVNSCTDNTVSSAEEPPQPSDESPAYEAFVLPEATDKLTVYTMSMTSYTLTPAVNIFKEKFPEVDVEVISYSDGEYETILKTELASGDGPDLFFSFGNDLPDIYKTMSTEIFVDLNQFLLRDDEYNPNDYVTGVMDAVLCNGKRYMVPIEYGVPLLLTAEEILAEESLTRDDILSFDGFLQAYEQYNANHPNDGNSVFTVSGFQPALRYFLLYSGIDLLDYETGTVAIEQNRTAFENIVTAVKKVYKPDEQISLNITGGLTGRKNLFDNFCTTANYMLMGKISYLRTENLTPVLFTCPNVGGNGAIAEIQRVAAIPKASENQLNAYRLLKILLSEEIQGGNDGGYSYLRLGNPVLKTALRAKIEADAAGMDNPIDEATITEYINTMTDVASGNIMPKLVYDYVIEEMTPYFEGTKSFDDCFARLVNVLELYISE